MSQFIEPTMSQPDDNIARHYASSESESKAPSSSSGKKRASRAGTRSVTTLTAAQLERKRANDRDAQRAIRKRTKDHIDSLEHRVNELTMNAEALERMNAALVARNRELEQENLFLRGRAGSDAFSFQLPNAEGKGADSAVGGQSTHTSPEMRFTPHDIPRPSSQAARHSISAASSSSSKRHDSWRQQSHPPAFAPSEGSITPSLRADSVRGVGWRNPGDFAGSIQSHSQVPQTNLQQQRSYSTPSVHEQRPTWNKPGHYGYIMDPSQQSMGYSSSGKAPAFPDNAAPGQYGLQLDIGGAQAHGSSFGSASLTTPSSEFQNLSMQSPAQTTPSQAQGHGHSFDVPPSQIQPASTYPAGTQQPRGGLASPYAQPPAPGGYPQPGLEYQSSAGPQGYQYGQYRGPG